MLVGEVPGDREDRTGRVFVGPAGRELDLALEEVGVSRADVYITNAVKHFKFSERGKRRIHQRPSRSEVRACNPWLHAEITAVRPRALVLLGATAGQALLGASFRLGEARGRAIESELRRSSRQQTTRRRSCASARSASATRSAQRSSPICASSATSCAADPAGGLAGDQRHREAVDRVSERYDDRRLSRSLILCRLSARLRDVYVPVPREPA